MKVTVIGATGTIGTLAVEKLLRDGHDVTAFARNPDRLEIDHPRLTRTAGDATRAGDVKAAVAGQDAVVITLGSKSLSDTIRSDGTRTVIRAMQDTGVRRLVCQSTLGAHESWSNLNLFWKRIMFGLILRKVFKDHEVQENLVRASGLDWTIVRPSAFTDDPLGYREDIQPGERKLTLKIARAEVAEFLSRQVADRLYLNRAVGISA